MMPRGTAVFVTCSNDDDVQVTCGEMNHLVDGLTSSPATVDFVHLFGVDHVLKVDTSRRASHYAKNLAFSPELRAKLTTVLSRYL